MFADVPDFTICFEMLDNTTVLLAKYRYYTSEYLAPTIDGCKPCFVLAEYDDIKNDLIQFKDYFQNIGQIFSFKDYIENYYLEKECDDDCHLINQALTFIIQKHIDKYGRLMISDMELFIDEAMLFHEVLKTKNNSYEELKSDRILFREYIIETFKNKIYVLPVFNVLPIKLSEYLNKQKLL